MARPPVEWPIPAYVAEWRERLVFTFRVRGREMHRLAPEPVSPVTLTGEGIVSLVVGSGRCLKSVGGIPVLASEFQTVELLMPVRWQPACRPPLQGICALHFQADSHGLVRLMRKALDLRAAVSNESLRAGSRKPTALESWPESSLFHSAEQAEALLLHPEYYFVPETSERLVRAVPVHHYARSTVAVNAGPFPLEWAASRLGLAPEALRPDHVLLQKRCTHTYSFPPETIYRTRPVASRYRSTAGESPVLLAA